MKKLLAVLLFTLPSVAFAVDLDLDGYYITPKGGVSQSMDTGTTNFTNSNGISFNLQDEDLGKGTAFGVSADKYITDSFRLELEAIKRDGYDYDARIIQITTTVTVSKADIGDYKFIYQWLL